MNLKKIVIMLLPACICWLDAISQNELDALRYSQTTFGGTARSMAAGGAFGALGGDFSSLSINPAGIAIYKKSELMITPLMFKSKVTSAYSGNTMSDDKYGFNFSNAGGVFSYVPANNSMSTGKWINWNWGIGYNRLNNFQSRSGFEGINSGSSMLDHYLNKVNAGSGTFPSDLASVSPGAYLAYQAYLINPLDTIKDTAHYNSVVPFGGALQRRNSVTKGGMGEYLFTFGANYNNRLYFGASMGLTTLRYEEKSEYAETDKSDTIPYFKSYTMNQSLKTTGSGVNFNFGMILRASDWLRLGASVHTPVLLSLTDEYSGGIVSDFDSASSVTASSQPGRFSYSVETPFRASGSAAVLVREMGFVSADYEIVDYSEASLSAAGVNYFDANAAIQGKYGVANNIRVGTEWRFDEYCVRGGYAHYGTPFKAGMNYPGADNSKTNYTLGFGIRDEGYYIDLAYVYSLSTGFYRPYAESALGAVNKSEGHQLLMTLGSKF